MSFFIRLFLFSLIYLVGLSSAQSILTSSQLASSYDVIIVGSEPEGISAAVAAAETGAKTLLITEDKKLGGLFVLGQMNSLDLRTDPFNFQQGLFLRWWQLVGKGHSFDIKQAETAFHKLLDTAGVTVLLNSDPISPHMKDGKVNGISLSSSTQTTIINASHIIDSSANMDFATQAGAKSSFGFSSIGFKARMADTLVFRIDNIDWAQLSKGIRAKGKSYASVDEHVAWGHFGGYPAAYKAVEEGIRLRGLNLGRQDDGSVLVNALLIYGINNPFDKSSLADGRRRATNEAARIIDYLSKELPGFERASFGGVADELYIRETRHLEAECILTTDDVLNNKVTPLDIAAGGYPLDVQTLTPYDNGYVYGKPDIYGVQLCVNVPKGVENLWVVGKSAGYDPIAASSARVVPFGMAVAEAVGAAAALAVKKDLSAHGFINETRHILDLRALLSLRGAYLPEVDARVPVGPFSDPNYDAYRLMLSRGLAVGGYTNNPDLNKPMSALSYVYLLSNVGQRFFDNNDLGQTIVAKYPDSEQSLTGSSALSITQEAACLAGYCVEASWQALEKIGIKTRPFDAHEILTRGEMYGLAAGIANLSTILSETR